MIPTSLVERMVEAEDFGVGISVSQQIFYAMVSLKFHTSDANTLNTTDMVQQLQAQYSPYPYVPDTYFQVRTSPRACRAPTGIPSPLPVPTHVFVYPMVSAARPVGTALNPAVPSHISSDRLPRLTLPLISYQASFGHLMGYSSNYYTYQWSLVIAKDLFTRFSEKGLFDAVVAGDYTTKVLRPGGTLPAAELVKNYLNRPYSFEPYMKWLTQQN